MQSENIKIQGDKMNQSAKWESVSSAWKSELEKRPVDFDLEKKQGDPLFDAMPSVPKDEPQHTGKLARELPEYHQGEAKGPLSFQAQQKVAESIETTTAALSEAKEIAQEKASELYESASHQAETMMDQAYEKEQILEQKVGSVLSAAYSAVAAVTSAAIEKGKDGLHYLGKEVYEISDTLAEKTDVAMEKASQTASYLNEKKDQVIQIAAEKAQAAIESVSEPIDAPVDYGTSDSTLTPEGFKDLEQAIKKFERSASFKLEHAEDASHPSEAASTLQMIADESKAANASESHHDSATEFMELEEKEADELFQLQQKAISQEKMIQREKKFVRRLSDDLTQSLRDTAMEFNKHQELEGATKDEMKPLLGAEPKAQSTI